MKATSGAGPALELRDLRVEFADGARRVHAVNGVSLRVAPGECLAVVGESGSGKSQTFLAALGLLPPAGRASGSVRLGGREILGLPEHELRAVRGAAIGTVFAAAYLLWLYQRTAFGTPTEEFGGGGVHDGHAHVAHSLSAAANADHDAHGDGDHGDIHDVTLVEWIAWTPFLIAIIVFGILPNLMFEVFDPAVTQLIDQVGVGLGK